MHLFLSPHSDDAPLCCGGTIYQLVEAEGEVCVILTFLSGDPPDPLPDSPFVKEFHERWQAGESPMRLRREEDLCAAKTLGARTLVNWELLDAIYRVAPDGTALYPTNQTLFGAVDPQDNLLETLLNRPLPYTPTHLYAPLGVGKHVDHQIVRDFALKLTEQNPDITLLFYQDYPYAERAQATETALSYYQDYSLTEQIRTLREVDVQMKLKSLRCYGSQISTFWGSITEMDERVSQFMQRTGAPIERYWRLSG